MCVCVCVCVCMCVCVCVCACLHVCVHMRVWKEKSASHGMADIWLGGALSKEFKISEGGTFYRNQRTAAKVVVLAGAGREGEGSHEWEAPTPCGLPSHHKRVDVPQFRSCIFLFFTRSYQREHQDEDTGEPHR